MGILFFAHPHIQNRLFTFSGSHFPRATCSLHIHAQQHTWRKFILATHFRHQHCGDSNGIVESLCHAQFLFTLSESALTIESSRTARKNRWTDTPLRLSWTCCTAFLRWECFFVVFTFNWQTASNDDKI